MGHIEQYLDLGYTGIVREAETAAGETVVCRDRQKRCLRLVVSLEARPGQDPKVKIERTELISEPRYQKALAERGVLDTEDVHRERSRRRMAGIAAQHQQAQNAPLCPRCRQRMQLALTRDHWVCPSFPPCVGQKTPVGR